MFSATRKCEFIIIIIIIIAQTLFFHDVFFHSCPFPSKRIEKKKLFYLWVKQKKKKKFIFYLVYCVF